MVTVDADSLWNIFMNYEKVKAESIGLKLDTMNLRLIVKQKDSQMVDLLRMVNNFENVIVPAHEQRYDLQVKITEIEIKKGNRKLLNGIGYGGAGVLILSLLLGGL